MVQRESRTLRNPPAPRGPRHPGPCRIRTRGATESGAESRLPIHKPAGVKQRGQQKGTEG